MLIAQAATVSLLRIFTNGGKTLCSIPEQRACSGAPGNNGFGKGASFSRSRAEAAAASGAERRSLDSCRQQAEDAAALPVLALAVSGRAHSLGLF